MTRAQKAGKRAKRSAGPPPRAERVRQAILDDLRRAGAPLPLAELETARSIARGPAELYIVAERLRLAGALERFGEGYHRGDPHRYAIPGGRS